MTARDTEQPAIDRVVGPGDSIAALPASGELRTGTGLAADGGHLRSPHAGVVCRTKRGKLWVKGRQKRYTPAVGDCVIGQITERHADGYALDISGPFPAQLPALAFEAATRRNRPELAPGDTAYARVVAADRDMEPELACTDASGKAAGFGPLKEGLAFSCSSALARQLLSRPPPAVLSALGGAGLQFELAVGQNGRVWVKSARPATTILVMEALRHSEFAAPEEAKQVVAELVAKGVGGEL